MKILVTGGTVFVSRFTAEYFLSKGHEVYVLNRNTRPQAAGVKLICADRRSVVSAFKGHRFDAVIDVTAYNAEDINCLLDGLGGVDSYVLISSSAVYPETTAMPAKVGDSCGANRYWGAYGTGKIAAENALLRRMPNAYILRPPYLYGEYNNVYREAFVFDCAGRGMPFYLPSRGGQRLQFFYVGDMCRFIEIILSVKPDRRIFNVGNSETVTADEWARLCYLAAGKSYEAVFVEKGIEQRSYFPFYDYEYSLDVAGQKGLMPTLTPLDEGLRRAYRWYSGHSDEVNKKDYIGFIEKNLRHR